MAPRKKLSGRKSGNKISKASKNLLKRIKENQERTKSGPGFFKDGLDIQLWKPSAGLHEFDLIPFTMGDKSPIYRGQPVCEEGDYDYLLDFWVHYSLGSGENQSCICLNRTYEQKCPVCEYISELRLDGRDDEADAIKAKRRTLYNIVCYDSTAEEDKGVQIWSVSYHYMEKFLLTLANRPVRRGQEDIDPLVNFASEGSDGRSITFKIEKGGKGSFDEYIGHQFQPRDYELDSDLLEQAESLDQLIHIPTYNEAKEILFGDTGEDEEREVEEEQPKRQKGRSNKTDNKRNKRSSNKSNKNSRRTRKQKEPDPEPEEDPNEQEGEYEEGGCPYGGEFGVDIEELEQCSDCEVFDQCFDASQGVEEEPDPEPEPEKKTRRGRGGRKRR